jgi:hypothetical protein
MYSLLAPADTVKLADSLPYHDSSCDPGRYPLISTLSWAIVHQLSPAGGESADAPLPDAITAIPA